MLYSENAFVALTVYAVLHEEKAWHLLSFTQNGIPISRARSAAHINFVGSGDAGSHQHQQWSTFFADAHVEQTSLFRFFDPEGSELTCTQSQWLWRVANTGEFDRVQPESNEDCQQ